MAPDRSASRMYLDAGGGGAAGLDRFLSALSDWLPAGLVLSRT
ncbi:hypothetical protein RCH27_23300 [Paracidovorax citrulli]|nr:hypothetical protein [Paracidovorax citrulli]